MTTQFVTQARLDSLSAEAATLPRLRRHSNFHLTDDAASHRLIIAIEPGSYIAPHRHLSATKDESIVVLRGRLGIVLFDDGGAVTATAIMAPGGDVVMVNIPHGTFHTLLALEPGSVFFESKAGPYLPVAQGEQACWAPQENEAAVPAYQQMLNNLFA